MSDQPPLLPPYAYIVGDPPPLPKRAAGDGGQADCVTHAALAGQHARGVTLHPATLFHRIAHLEAANPMTTLSPTEPEIVSQPYPPPAAPCTPFHLTPEQIRFFDDHGYLVLRQWIPPKLLERARAAADAWIEHGLRATPDDPVYDDFHWKKGPNGRVFYSVVYVHNMGEPASLELLGSPQVMAVAESMCGPNFVPTYESMVFKMTGEGAPIHWHQDACHPRRYRIYNFDVYLDASRSGAGALRVVPRSQRARVDVCALDDNHGWNPPGVMEVEMEPGDVLLHDVMVVHGSEPVVGKALRRTIYYEFRPAEEILEDGPWDRNWIDRRLRLIPLGLRRHQEAFLEADQYEWRISDEFRPVPSGSEAEELRVAHIKHMPGSYCSAGDAGTGKRLLVD